MSAALHQRLVAGLALWLAAAAPLLAQEEILRFEADIEVAADASMAVTETIEVRAEGREIRRGIYRDLPLSYRDRFGHRVRVTFELLDVRRDGQPEPYQVEPLGNGVRIRIGSAERFLDPGVHRYRIRYRTGRQLGFFDDFDELYWNVTGTGWGFRIATASAAVTLPAPVPASKLRLSAYTGPQGSTARNAEAQVADERTVRFETTTPLDPGEGLTIAVGFPKGLVTAPSGADRARWFFADNGHVLVGLGGLVLLLGYYFHWWRRVGRDPDRGVVIPIYEPPEGLSPGAVRYLYRRGYDHTAFVAAVVNLAVSGALRLAEEKKKWWVFRERTDVPMSAGEKALYHELLGSRATLEFDQDNHRAIAGAVKAHKARLKREIEGVYLLRHRGRWAPGVAISVVTLLAMVALKSGLAGGAVVLVAVIPVLMPLVMVAVVFMVLRHSLRQRGGGLRLLVGGLLGLFVLGPTLVGLAAGLGDVLGLGALLILAAHVLSGALFFYWMEAPTEAGRDLLDHLEGLKLYMDVAEKDELVRQQEPAKTIERFERLLPYAIALDVARTWADHFEDELTRAMAADELRDRGWATSSVTRGDFSGSALAGGLAAGLGKAIASSSSPPGSSSGSGGGGFSGGGGGGGGGGGW